MEKKDLIKLISELLLSNTSVHEIACRLKKNKAIVYRIIKENNIYNPYKDHLQHKIDTVIKLFLEKQEMSLAEIGKQVGISKSRVTQILKQNNIEVPTERKNKIRTATCITKYGKTNVMHVDDVIKSREEYFLNKFASTSPFGSKQVLDKCKATLMENYGVDNPLKSTEIQKKVNNTNIKKYGGPSPASNTQVTEKMSNTYYKNTGYRNPANNPITDIKKRATCTKKYKVTHHMKDKDIVDKVINSRLNSGYNKRFNIDGKEFTTAEVCKKFNFTRSAVLQASKVLSYEDWISWLKRENDRSSSRLEKEILDFVKSNYKGQVYNRYLINGREADIYIPDLNFAIEVNGDYFHSYPLKDKKYHFNKKTIFTEAGLISMFIYECDWHQKSDIIKSMLLNKLGRGIKLFARKCIVQEVNSRDTYNFLEENHLQGSNNFKISLGLYHNKELISIMTFGRPRYDKKVEWELLRFCNKKGFSVLGGFPKLFKYFINKYLTKNIITYCDLDYGTGTVYAKNGFKFIRNTKLGYFYSKDFVRYNRQRFQKSKLINRLNIFDPNKTELENMLINKYFPIFTCGNAVFIYTKF